MDKRQKIMSKSIQQKFPVYYSETFRTPLSFEKELNLWVDRIGEKEDIKPDTVRLRVLNLFALVFIEKGTGFLISQSEGKIRVNPGDVIFVPPDEPICYFPTKRWKEKWTVWGGPEAYLLYDSGLLDTLKFLFQDPLKIVDHTYIKLRTLIDREDISAILERKITILQMIYRLINYRLSTGSSHLINTPFNRIDRAIEYINTHINNTISVDKLARISCLSPAYFRKLFKLRTGRTPKQFITTLKISRAKELLTHGKTIKEIASILGYTDIFHFMKTFKRVTGVSPGRYQQSRYDQVCSDMITISDRIN